MEVVDAALLSDVGQCHRDMPREIGELSTFEQEDIARHKTQQEDNAIRPEYQRALEIAFMVLNAEGVLLDRPGPDRTLNSFILNLEEVVESYFRNSTRRLVAPDILVEDGNKVPAQPGAGFWHPHSVLRMAA